MLLCRPACIRAWRGSYAPSEADLRWVVLGVIQETARHAGHADIIREQIDGQRGR
jgi:hypothetical protein